MNIAFKKMAINKEAFADDFFKLSIGVLDEVTQKFINYHFQVAIVGDFSKYTSKPLCDLIYECNSGKDFVFVDNEEQAIEKLVKE